jgi:mannose-6-phosphate isomerase-like protein (cupin superfamily)
VADEILRLSSHEDVRVVRDAADELELAGTWRPGGSPPPAHLHPSQDEYFEVRSGHLTAVVDGVKRQLGPGDTLQIPRRTPHKMWNAGTESATATWRTRPGGRTLDWLRTIHRLGGGGTRKPPLPALARAVNKYPDVFQLAIRPKPLQPVADLALRVLALGWR